MTIFSYILVAFLIVCAVAVCLNKNLLTSIVIFMSYSVIMCIIWILRSRKRRLEPGLQAFFSL